jgi:hypothetical protein
MTQTLMLLSSQLRYQGRIAESVQLAEESYALYAGLGSRLMHAYGTLRIGGGQA